MEKDTKAKNIMAKTNSVSTFTRPEMHELIEHHRIGLTIARWYAPQVYAWYFFSSMNTMINRRTTGTRTKPDGCTQGVTIDYKSVVEGILSSIKPDLPEITSWLSKPANFTDTDVYAFTVEAQQVIDEWESHMEYIREHWISEDGRDGEKK